MFEKLSLGQVFASAAGALLTASLFVIAAVGTPDIGRAYAMPATVAVVSYA